MTALFYITVGAIITIAARSIFSTITDRRPADFNPYGEKP